MDTAELSLLGNKPKLTLPAGVQTLIAKPLNSQGAAQEAGAGVHGRRIR